MANALVQTEEYLSFRCAIPLKRIIVDSKDAKEWKYYDAGPKSITSPLICLPPASANAEVFFKQVLSLSSLGYRIIALDYPVYWTVDTFCNGLRKLIDHLRLEQVHIFGCSVGGFLAIKFAERMRSAHYVSSLILCNSFTDTSVFKFTRSSSLFWMVPSFILKRLVLKSYPTGLMDKEQAEATDFHVECLEHLAQSEIASRLTIHCSGEYVRHPEHLQHLPVTIMEVFDDSVLSQKVKDDVFKCFPLAKRACLKSGGNFPYLSRSPEVNLYLRIHLKQFEDNVNSALARSESPSPTPQLQTSPFMTSVAETEDKSHLRETDYRPQPIHPDESHKEQILEASSSTEEEEHLLQEDEGAEAEDFPI